MRIHENLMYDRTRRWYCLPSQGYGLQLASRGRVLCVRHINDWQWYSDSSDQPRGSLRGIK
jgi:hypothetical protein